MSGFLESSHSGASSMRAKLLSFVRKLRKPRENQMTYGDTSKNEFSASEAIFRDAAAAHGMKLMASAFTPDYLFGAIVHSPKNDNLFEYMVSQGFDDGKDMFVGMLDPFCKGIPDFPFIALDFELIGAFAYAQRVITWFPDHTVHIIVVNAKELWADSVVSCNDLRLAVGLDTDERLASQVLAWEDLPEESIIWCQSWKEIKESPIGRCWFRPLLEPYDVQSKAWTERSKDFVNGNVEVSTMIVCLVNVFEMNMDGRLMRRLLDIFYAWSRGRLELRDECAGDFIYSHPELGRDFEKWVVIIRDARVGKAYREPLPEKESFDQLERRIKEGLATEEAAQAQASTTKAAATQESTLEERRRSAMASNFPYRSLRRRMSVSDVTEVEPDLERQVEVAMSHKKRQSHASQFLGAAKYEAVENSKSPRRDSGLTTSNG